MLHNLIIYQVLEYYQDLWFWYQGGYGNEINRDVACPQIKDLADTFKYAMPAFEHPDAALNPVALPSTWQHAR